MTEPQAPDPSSPSGASPSSHSAPQGRAQQQGPSPSGGVPPSPPPPTVARRRRVSWIWIVPIVAALAGLSMVVRTWMHAGPRITISFETAEGLEVGTTQLRYKDVVVGTVSGIRLTEDRSQVQVQADLIGDAQSLAQEGTRFWVVRPRLGVSGVSGLGTLLSGAYIGVDAGPPDKQAAARTEFVGLESPPEVTSDRPGTRYTLKTADLGSLDVGSPVYYRRIPVGRVIGYQLDPDGRAVSVQIFVDAPANRFVTARTRFWNASGVDMSVNANGVNLRTQSLVSVLAGGIAFDPLTGPAGEAAQAPEQHVFKLYAGEAAARAEPEGRAAPVRMRFDQSVRGLSVGASVDFRGLDLGSVTAMQMGFDTKRQRFYTLVDADIFPERLGPAYEQLLALAPDGKGENLLKPMVDNGLRAQLRSGNLLTGQLYVALDFFPGAAPVKDFQPQVSPAAIPTIPGDFDQLQQQVSSIVGKLEKVPFDEIGTEMRNTLANMSRMLARIDRELTPEARDTLRQARQSLDRVDGMLGSGSSLPASLERALQELERAARSLRVLSDGLQTHPESLLRGRSRDADPYGGP